MKMKKYGIAALAVAATLSLAACSKETPSQKNAKYVKETGASAENDLDIFTEQLGGFNSQYLEAKKITDDSERYVAMAKAEAELLKQSVFLPTSTIGGNYAITKVAPRTAPYAMWGSDEYRYKTLVFTNEDIKKTDREKLLADWNEKKGDSSYDPVSYAKNYLNSKGYTFSDKYQYQYIEGAKTFDALATSLSADTEVTTNFNDGLIEYDGANRIVGALAESWEKKTVGGKVVYDFKIRDNMYWADNSTGKATSYKITAQDFVTGFQHMLDASGGLEYLVQGVIEGADEYLNGTTTDFNDVGVKAIDNNTVRYTLCNDCSYFLTYLSYNIYQPLNKEYFESKGGRLGIKEFAEASAAESYTYGKTKSDVLSSGAYYVAEYADKGNLTFKKVENYWDTNTQINEITWMFNDGQNQLKGYNAFKDGTLSGVGLNTAAIEQTKNQGLFNDYAFVSDTQSTTYFAAYNLNRQTFVLSNGSCESAQSVDNAKLTNKAMQNQKFRLALNYAFDKATWNGQSVGDELKLNSLRNSYTPWDFVSTTKEVTTQLADGTSKTYQAGTEYGQILQDQLTALGVKADLHDSTDGWYNVENAKKAMADAIEELKTDGVTIDSKNKVVIDVNYYEASTIQTNQANAYKKSIEDALGDYVQVNLIPASTTDDYYSCGYRAADGAAANYDVFYGSGWGPDYGDPSTYLDTFLSEGAGYMTKTIGLW